MTDDRKPLNPLERQENTGVVDGTNAPMAEGRHGLDADVVPEDVEREKVRTTAVTDKKV